MPDCQENLWHPLAFHKPRYITPTNGFYEWVGSQQARRRVWFKRLEYLCVASVMNSGRLSRGVVREALPATIILDQLTESI